jgi:putative transposase
MSDDTSTPARVRWARLRFQIIGQLLAAPPEPGELSARIAELAARSWRHATTGEVIRFSAKAIERWFYVARGTEEPIRALERKVPQHAGSHPSVSDAVAAEIARLRRDHPRWSYRLVHDNLVVLARENPSLGKLPGYASLCRYMKHHGLGKRRRLRRHELEPDFVPRERRSYEVSHVHALWHFDFHEARRSVVLPSGERQRPVLLGILDDHSRLCCHAQWYLDPENTESLIHGLCQAFQKRGLPRAVLSDNGAAMLAAETQQGLERLSILQHLTLPQSPEQNGKQESFWTLVEGRLMAMLEGEPELTLELLNRATQAWVEQEYQRRTARPAKPRWNAASPPRPSSAPRAMRSGARSGWKSGASSASPTAPSPSRACATSCPPPTAPCSGSACASRAGISPASISSTREAARTSPRCCRSTGRKMPTEGAALCRATTALRPTPPSSHHEPPASPRSCVS